MRIVKELVRPGNRGKRQAARVEFLHEVCLRVTREHLLDDREQPVLFGGSPIVRRKRFVGGQLVQAERVAQDFPLLVAHDANEHQIVVLGFKHLVDRPGRNARRHWCSGLACDRVLGHVLTDEKHGALKQRCNDFLAFTRLLALEQCAENAERTEHPPLHVDYGCARAKRSSGRAGHVREPAHHLRDLVHRRPFFVGAGEKAFFRAINQALVSLPQRIVAKSQPIHRSRPKVFDQDVRVVDEAKHRGFPPG